ncbi:unnamed protein product [Cylicocyclus nassatus]|uniref:Uncharacterized protein n=1 Tax=Cylicocyclus nassatus TaxID=53992 RepID=A0AA36M820_CYLNA|nr:unnamed protein product [Cylicocyclus nassatus]
MPHQPVMFRWTIFFFIQLVSVCATEEYVPWETVKTLPTGAVEDGENYQAVYLFTYPVKFKCDIPSLVNVSIEYLQEPPQGNSDLCRATPLRNMIHEELRCRRRQEFLHEEDWIEQTLEDFINETTDDHERKFVSCRAAECVKILVGNKRLKLPAISKYTSSFIPN